MLPTLPTTKNPKTSGYEDMDVTVIQKKENENEALDDTVISKTGNIQSNSQDLDVGPAWFDETDDQPTQKKM